MTKKEMDIQLIESCIAENWNMRAMGCFDLSIVDNEACVLCQVYGWIKQRDKPCLGCPITEKDKYWKGCKYDEYTDYCGAIVNEDAEGELDAIEAMVEFLIQLLPETHPWRIEQC